MKATVMAVHSDAVAAVATAAHSVVAATAEASAVVRQQAEAAHAEDDEKVKDTILKD